jgi:Delta7-sterol 5-desaturase
MTAAPPILASMLALVAIVGIRYLAVSGAFAWLTLRRRREAHAGLQRQIRREIGWSLLSAGIYGLPAGLVAWGWANHGWTQLYTDIRIYPWWWLPASILLYLLLHDSWFYWTHRLMHRPGPFRLAHAVHHASRPPTAWAAMSFHPIEALSGAVVIPVLVMVVPIHVGALLAVLSIMTVMGVTNHMGWELFPARLVRGRAGRWLITASHHHLHHRDYRSNYGLYFRHWDRLCGTDRGLARFDGDEAGGTPDPRGAAARRVGAG